MATTTEVVRPKTTVVVKKKKKKLIVAPKPVVTEQSSEQQKPFEEVARDTPAEKIRGLARGFRLSFHGLGSQRKVSDEQKKTMLEGRTDTELTSLNLTKKLFAKHPALKKLSSAKSQVEAYFHARTIDFPEKSVRVMLLDLPADYEKMSTEDLDKFYAEQVNNFRGEMRRIIAEKYDTAVTELQAVWGDVLEKAQADLKSQFEAKHYPTAERLPYICRCVFEGYNVELSKDWKHLSPVERERELNVVRQKFEAAVAKQEEFVVALLNDAIEQMLDSLSNFQGGEGKKKTRSFKSSVVTRVFGALDEFKRKTVKYGILKDSAVEDVFRKVRKVLTDGGLDRKTLPDLLRKSEEKRKDMIDKVKKIGSSLTALIQSGQTRRKLLRD